MIWEMQKTLAFAFDNDYCSIFQERTVKCETAGTIKCLTAAKFPVNP